MLDVAETAMMGTVANYREVLEFFTVGPELGSSLPGGAPPGTFVPGEIAMRVQDANGAFGTYSSMPQGAVTSTPGGPLGTSLIRMIRGARVSATTVGTFTYVCAVDDQGHILLAERRGQPTVDGDGVPLGEGRKWVLRSADLRHVWDDLNRGVAAPGASYVDVACAATSNPTSAEDELHILGVASDGKVWYGMATRPLSAPSASNFTPFVPVTALPEVNRIAAVAADNQLHVVALGRGQSPPLGTPTMGQPWYTVRSASGAWRAPEDIRAAMTSEAQSTGYMDVAMAFCDDGVSAPAPNPPRQLNVALLRQAGIVEMAVHTGWAQNWGENGASTHWLHQSQWDGSLDVVTGPLVRSPQTLFGISLAERPFRP
jgi:hypothetical protein